MTPHQQIEAIDQQIDANRRTLYRAIGYLPTTAMQYQVAYDRNPILSARQRDLFRQRGIAQLARDEADHKAWQTQERKRLARERAERSKRERARLLCCIDHAGI